MPRLALIASLALLTLFALPVRDAAALKVCPLSTTLDSITVTEIGFGTVLHRGDVHYLEGKDVYLDVKHTLCSAVTQVKVGNTVIGTTAGVEPTSQWYTVVSSSVTADGKLLTRLKLTVSNLGYGDEKPVEVKITAGAVSVAKTVTLAPVLTVNSDTGKAALGFSEADINNGLVEALYARYVNPANAVIDIDEDGENDIKLYAIEFGDLGTTVDSTGLHFDLQLKATTASPSPLPCDPTIVLSADLKLVINNLTQLGISWNNGVGPTASVSFPTGCVIAADVLLLLLNPVAAAGGLVAYPFFIDYLEDVIGESVKADVETAINSAFADYSDSGSLAVWTQGPDYFDAGEIRVYPTLTESVTVKVPYDDSRRLSTGYGMPITAGDRPLVFSAGTAEICSVDNATWPNCTHVLTGPMGVYYAPNHTPNNGIWFGDPLKMYNGLAKVQRWNGAPPWSGVAGDEDIAKFNVGRMLGRHVAPGLAEDVQLGEACRLSTVSSARSKITFGVNDTQPYGYPRGAGTYLATVIFLPSDLATDQLPVACKAKSVYSAPPPSN